MKRLLVLLLLVVTLGGSFLGWRSCRHARHAFTPAEQALIDDVVELYTIRITRSSDPDLARAMLDSLQLRIPLGALDRHIDQLALDPARTTRVLQAIHDSLNARRERFLDQESQGNAPVPRTGEELPTDD